MSIMDPDILVKRKVDAVLLQSQLTVAARKKADVIAKRVLDYNSSIRHRKPILKEYPPVVVACAQNETNHYVGITRHNVLRKDINRDLLDRLEDRLGPYGESTEFAPRCYIGHCAEPQAANKLLRNEYVNDLDDIYFGNAYRPRTGVVIPPCNNCRRMFNNLVIR